MTAVANRHQFQTEITPDAVLQLHDQIAFLQIREINVERGARGQRVRGFLAARSLDFVAAENFRIGDDDEFGLVADETTGEGAEVQRRTGVAPVSNFFFLCFFRWRQAGSLSYEFHPNFRKPLAFAVVVAKDMDRVILPQPAVELLKKLAPLRLGDWRLRRTFGQRTERVERSKPRNAELQFGRLEFRLQPLWGIS